MKKIAVKLWKSRSNYILGSRLEHNRVIDVLLEPLNKEAGRSIALSHDREESPDNTGQRAFERKDTCEGMAGEKKITAFPYFEEGRVRVRRQGKSLPGSLATTDAVPLAGCKAKYTGD